MKKVAYREKKTGRDPIPGDNRWHQVFDIAAHKRGGYGLYVFQGALVVSGLDPGDVVAVEFQFMRQPMRDGTGGVDLIYTNGRYNVVHMHTIAVRKNMQRMGMQFKHNHPTANVTVVQRIAKVLT